MLFMQKRDEILFAVRISLVCEFSSKEDHSVIYESIYYLFGKNILGAQ